MNRIAAMIGAAAVLALFVLLSGWVGPDSIASPVEALVALAGSLPLPLLWLTAAIGLGWPLRSALARQTSHPCVVQVALGVAGLLLIDSIFGSLGWLALPAVAWGVLAAGGLLLLAQVVRMRVGSIEGVLPEWPFWACAPAVAVLLVAAVSAPGWLWSSEFGGYDALSYHLQLPKEWLARGRITPLEHNVYSFLPGYVEAAYLHMMALRSDAMGALLDCQLLHALLTLCAAGMTGALCSQLAGRWIGALAAALFLATPWAIVVGSLAYNEMATAMMLAAGLVIVLDERLTAAQRGALVGLASAAAVGAKLTSIGFVAIPLGAALLLRTAPRRWLAAFAIASLVGLMGLLPYLLRNWAHAGNPVFPFASYWLGAAHWTPEQVHAWSRGHMSDAAAPQRVLALWSQWFRYGIGANPQPGEPWLPQWGFLPWLGIAGGVLAMLRSTHRREAVILAVALAAQIGFWIGFTHLQSRFVLPAIVPLCALVALGLHSAFAQRSAAGQTSSSPRIAGVCAAIVLGLSLLPVWIYRREAGGAPALAIGTVSQQTGQTLDDSARRELGATAFPAVAVNWLLPAPPAPSPPPRVLFIGEAAPLYFDLDRIAYNTVWDRGPLSIALRQHPDDPQAALDMLRSMGFTHVLVNPTMLAIWQRDDWNDPLITPSSVRALLDATGKPLFHYPRPSDISIHALPK